MADEKGAAQLSIRAVREGKWRAWCDTVRATARGEIVVLSMFGPHNAVRAIWARMVGSRLPVVVGAADGMSDDDTYKLADDGAGYFRAQAPLDHQRLHTVLLHASTTHHASPFSTQFAQVGPRPEVAYFARLSRFCPVPLRDSWRESLWVLGQREGLIVELQGHGMPGYAVDATDAWAGVVRGGIETGALG